MGEAIREQAVGEQWDRQWGGVGGKGVGSLEVGGQAAFPLLPAPPTCPPIVPGILHP